MSWPTNLPNSAAFDADADSVAASRPELKKMSDAVNTLASNVYTAGSTTGTITPDVANGEIQRITLTGNITMNAFANPVAGQRLTMIFKQPAAGSTFDLTSNMLWENGLESLTQINGAVDTADIFYDGTNYFARMNLAHGSVEVYPFESNFTVVGDDSSGSLFELGNTLKFAGSNGATVSVVNDVVTISGATGLTNPLSADLNVNDFAIVNNVTDGHVNLTPNGTGDVRLNTDTVRVGDSNADATITTNGTGDLTLNTNSGTNSSYITIEDGASGNITIKSYANVLTIDNDNIKLGKVNTDGKRITTPSASNLILDTNNQTNSPVLALFAGGGITISCAGSGTVDLQDETMNRVILKDYAETVYNRGNVTGSFSITVSNGNTQRMRLTGNITFTGFADALEGQTVTLIITQDGTGGRTFTEGLDSAGRMLFAGGVSTLSTGANSTDIMSISYIAGTYYASINKNYS